MATSQRQTARPALVARLIHASLVSGCVIFGLVIHFVARPQRTGTLPVPALYGLLGVSLGALLLSLAVLRPRVPLKSSDESADLYWTRALTAALLACSAKEADALLAMAAYLLDGAMIALAMGAVATGAMIVLNPRTFERT
jgi:hypothetical protein